MIKKEGHRLFCAKLFWEWLVIGFLSSSFRFVCNESCSCPSNVIFLQRQHSFSDSIDHRWNESPTMHLTFNVKLLTDFDCLKFFFMLMFLVVCFTLNWYKCLCLVHSFIHTSLHFITFIILSRHSSVFSSNFKGIGVNNNNALCDHVKWMMWIYVNSMTSLVHFNVKSLVYASIRMFLFYAVLVSRI